MKTRPAVIAFLGLNVVIWALLLWVRGVTLSWEMLWPFGIAVALSSLAVAAFVRWWWAWPILQGWLVDRPDLRGTWRALVTSDWVDPTTGTKTPPIPCFAVIRQTLTAVSLRLVTSESSSASIAVALARAPEGLFQLGGVYQNVPDLGLRGARSEIHFGALLLHLQADDEPALSGEYWTSRGTRGNLELAERNPRLVASFVEAQQLLGGP